MILKFAEPVYSWHCHAVKASCQTLRYMNASSPAVWWRTPSFAHLDLTHAQEEAAVRKSTIEQQLQPHLHCWAVLWTAETCHPARLSCLAQSFSMSSYTMAGQCSQAVKHCNVCCGRQHKHPTRVWKRSGEGCIMARIPRRDIQLQLASPSCPQACLMARAVDKYCLA
jgi:hypothetical protein